MNLVQLDFFKSYEECELDQLKKQIEACRISNEKVRKKLFAENGKHIKEIHDLKERITHLERFVCHLKYESS